MRRAKATARGLFARASSAPTDREARAAARHAVVSLNGPRLREMVKLAASEPGVAVEPHQLDADPWSLCITSGTLDLHTGTLRPHQHRDRITKLAPVAFDPAADAPDWKAFLERVLPDAAVRGFVQRAVGYSLTGLISEQVFFILHGTGAIGSAAPTMTG